MPELPEVETVCRHIEPLVTGRKICQFDLHWHRTLASQQEDFSDAVHGRTIDTVFRRAKLICLGLDDGAVVTVHLRMTGELLWTEDRTHRDPSRQPYLRANFALDDGSSLLFYDTRKFGRIAYIAPGDISKLDRMYGIEPLAPEFTPAWLYSALQSKKRQLKPLLLDQTFIAGLGNIYVDEALFASRLHPLTRSDLVSRRKSTGLHRAIVAVLSSAIERQGTTLRDYRSGLGEEGQNAAFLQVYGSKAGTACPRCGAGLARLTVGQRGTVFCPRCQRLPAATRSSRR